VQAGGSYLLTSNAVASGPNNVVGADFNGDGKLDLAVPTSTGISILLGNGDGTFQPQITQLAGTAISQLVVGDFNNDGKPDLALTTANSSSITILLGNGDGTFTAAATSPTVGGFAVTFVLGDFNGDKKLDVAVLSYNGSNQTDTVSVFFGRGNGTFESPKNTAVGNALGMLVAGDFNGDGKLDLVAGVSRESGPLWLLAGDGEGTFQTQEIVASESLPFGTDQQVVAADFNSDGNLDLAVLSTESNTAGDLTVLLGNGDGTFQNSSALTQSLQAPFFASGVAIGKFNGDAHLDIAVANESGNSVMLFSGYGDGTFTPAHVYPTVSSPQALVAADLDGNGALDFASLSSGGSDNSVSVALATLQYSALNFLPSVPIDPVGIANHSLECSYSGDSNYGASTSSPMAVGFLTAAAPQFSLLVGDYPAAQPVAITDASPGAAIFYTTDGSDPTIYSTVYTGPITISSTVKLKAIAGGIYLPSGISEAVYTITDSPEFAIVSSAVTPKVSPGTAATSETVSMSDKTPGAVIYYTTDGTTPSIKSSRYTGAITLTKATTIKAFAAFRGLINSPIVAVTFDITQPAIPDIAWTAPRPITYGTALSATELDATASNAGTFTYSPRTGTVLDAGAHKLTVTFTPSDRAHYTTATKTIQIEVFKKALTVAAARLTKVYGASMPRLAYTLKGFVNGDTAAKAVKGEPVLATTATAKSPVGSYAITITAGTLSSANYSFVLLRGSIEVTKAELKVRVANLVMTQGGAVPALRFVIDGFVLGDTQSSATTGEPKLTTTATSESKPGYYSIDVTAGTLAATNYSFTYDNGTLIVVK
jgi:hypothetical protein